MKIPSLSAQSQTVAVRKILSRILILVGLCFTLIQPVSGYDFDTGTKFANANEWADWFQIVEESQSEHEDIENCLEDENTCQPLLKPVRVLIQRAEKMTTRKQLELINRYINSKTRYARDKRTEKETEEHRYFIRQEWSSLLTFLKLGGDCEDYATAKYALLRLLDFEPEDLRIVIVYDRQHREHHAIVAVRLDDDSVRLLDTDNKIHRRRPFNYRYVYAINETSIWDHSLDQERKARLLPLPNSESN